MDAPGGKVAHAELEFGNQMLMLSDEFEKDKAPQPVGLPPVRLHLYVEDVDRVVDRAVQGGAKILIPVKDQFYGDRSGRLLDPFGHIWLISTHKEDVSQQEVKKRMESAMAPA